MNDALMYIFALLLVITLIVGLSVVMRLIMPKVQNMNLKGGRRLKIIETLILDARTRLMIIAHDDHEHLVLLSPTGAQVVEDSHFTDKPLKRKAKKA